MTRVNSNRYEKIIKLNLEGEDIRYLNPSCIKEVKKNKSKYNNDICVTLVLQDDNIITRLYDNNKDADMFVDYVIECIESS